MNSDLRHIAVYVDEPTEQDFRWVLHELGAYAQWITLESSQNGRTTYKEAMADGLQRLEGLVANLDTGPRLGESEKDQPNASPSKTVAPKSLAVEGEVHKTRSVFGFGLAN